MTDFAPQPLPDWRRAVLKIGSSLLAGDGGLDPVHARGLAAFIAASRAQGREVVLVSSGAVAAGRGRIGAAGTGIARNGIVQRQALAALGQASLMGFWQSLFAVPAWNSSFRFGARISRDRVTRKRISSIGAQVAPSFQVVT